MKNRLAHNRIKVLHKPDGTMTKTQEEVQEVTINFYKQLLGTTNESLPMINPSVMKHGNILTKTQ